MAAASSAEVRAGARADVRSSTRITDKDPAIVKSLLESFELCGANLVKYKAAAVKRNAAIRELMKVSVDVAELCADAVKDSSEEGRDWLVHVWGGSCEKICRLLIVLDEVGPELPDEYASAGQWKRCKHNIETIKKVLDDLGLFRFWNRPLGAQPPKNLKYAMKKRYSPSEKLHIMPTFDVDGGDPNEYSIDKPLPEGLKFDCKTGCIVGRSLQPEVPETTYTIIGKNDRGACSTTITFAIGPPPPSEPSYANPNLMYVGEAAYWKPAVDGVPTKWTISPALPQGLELQEDGTIAGICGKPTDSRPYTVTCSNSSGEASVVLNFEIKAAPPISLRYIDLKPEYFEKENLRINPELKLKKAGENILEAFARRAVSGRGPAKLATLLRNKALSAAGVKFTVEPRLPAGLDISPSTGVISGTPEASQDQVVYKVTATNPSGSVSCEVPLTIRCAAPENVRYPAIKRTYFTGEAVSESPLFDGVVDKWSIAPALPDGLTLQTDTGVLTGVPTTPTAMAPYEITATNDMGEGKCVAEFEVIRAAPKNLKYIDAESVYPKFATVAMNPVCEGENITYRVEPALVNGLSIDPATGVISGVPQEIAPEIPYKVIASNETGSCETVVPFAVEVKPPTDLHYPGVLPQYNVGESVNLAPTLEGGADKFSIEPALPPGMTFDERTGVIGGASQQVSSPEIEYTVTAENEGGGTSTVVTFEVVPLPPKDLRYIGVKDEYTKDEETVQLEADTVNCIACVYSIEPPLPAGMRIDPNTALIYGVPSELRDPTGYTVTATNQSGVCSTTLGFAVREQINDSYVDQAFAKQIDECTDIAELLAMEPAKDKAYGNWMVWMVHRAYLNDPSLVEFNFSNMIMPMPKIEWRVAPKLMEALATNTTIETLLLPASNLRRTEGKAFSEALGKNASLKTVDVASNDLDQESIKACAVSLKANNDTKLEKWAFSNNAGITNFGAPTEEAIYELLKTNKTISKLGCALQNPGYRDGINRALLRNGDIQRRLRRGGGAAPQAATKKVLKQVMLDDPPTDKAAFEVFPPEDVHLTKTREYIAEKRVVPNSQALQNYMKGQGTPVGFSAVGPLLKKVRGLLLDTSKQHEVTCCDSSGNDTRGVLKEWKEQNKNWNLQVMIGTSKLFNFETTNDPEIRVGDGMAKWLS